MKITIKDKFNCIAIFFIIFCSVSFFALSIPAEINLILEISMTGLIFAGNYKNVRCDLKTLICFFIYLMISLISLLIFNGTFTRYALVMVNITIAFIIYLSIDYKKFVKYFNWGMIVICIVSLLCYFLAQINYSIFSKLPVIYNSVGAGAYNFGLVVIPFRYTEFIRNYGFFWEPGVFQFFINLALYFELFNLKKVVQYRYVIIYSLTVATTLSTTGYVTTLMLLIAFFTKQILLKKQRIKYNRRNIIIIILLLVVVGILIFNPSETQNFVFSKLDGLFSSNKNMGGSTEVRINSIKDPLAVFLKNPLLGIGIDQFLLFAKINLLTMSTCTPINWFACFGILWGSISILGYLSIIKEDSDHLLTTILLMITFLLMISSEDYQFNIFIYLLIFYGLDNLKFKYRHRKIYGDHV